MTTDGSKRPVTATIYGTRFECLRPGCWRSMCGWYMVERITPTWWIGKDLETGKEYTGSSLMTTVWWTLEMTNEKYGKVLEARRQARERAEARRRRGK